MDLGVCELDQAGGMGVQEGTDGGRAEEDGVGGSGRVGEGLEGLG